MLQPPKVPTVYESDAKQTQTPPQQNKLFTDVTAQNKFKYAQTENDYIDFKESR